MTNSNDLNGPLFKLILGFCVPFIMIVLFYTLGNIKFAGGLFVAWVILGFMAAPRLFAELREAQTRKSYIDLISSNKEITTVMAHKAINHLNATVLRIDSRNNIIQISFQGERYTLRINPNQTDKK